MNKAPTKQLGSADFTFPKYAALVNHLSKTTFTLGLVKRVKDTRPVHVRIGSALDQHVVYEHHVSVGKHQAMLLRSAWLRPDDNGVDGARPLTIQVLIDGETVLEQPIDQHIRTGYPFPRKHCSCNFWGSEPDCTCKETPLSIGGFTPLFSAVRCVDAVVGSGVGEAHLDMPYGIFLPNDSVVQVVVVKPGSGTVRFKATCGITAALYSTKAEDIPC